MHNRPPQAHNGHHQATTRHCFICATVSAQYWAVGPCGHPYCALCALRLRALLATTACPMCKSDHRQVFVSKDHDAKFDDRAGSHQALADNPLGLVFESADCKSAVLAWMNVKCALCCQKLASKDELRQHLQSKHRKLLCESCLLHKPVFSFELQLFNHQSELLRHQNDGRQGHPLCTACKGSPRFYSEDELVLHCRDKHEPCPICVRRGNAASAYFADLAALQQHFEQQHFVCKNALCVELKFVVFDSELELKLHHQAVHLAGQKLSRSQQRAASRINVTFVRDDSHAESSRPAAHASTSTSTFTPVANRALVHNYDRSFFMFDAQLDEGHVQSMAVLGAKNKEFQDHLDAIAVGLDKKKALQAECRKFQSGRTTAVDLVHWMSVAGIELKTTAPKLVELLPDRLKQVALERAFDSHFKLQDAFPCLPSAKKSSSGGSGGSGSTWMRGQGPLPNEPIRGRILEPITGRILGHQTAQRPSRAPFNPMANPLLLLGPSPSSTRPKKTGASAEGTKKQPSDKQPCEKPAPAESGSAKAAPRKDRDLGLAHDNDDDGSSMFTIGQAANRQPTQQPTQEPKACRKKGSLVMRFGGFSTPQNNM